MRTSKTLLASLALGMVATAGIVIADETGKLPPAPQKEIKHEFLDSIVGTWVVESTAVIDGKELKGTGKVSYTKGIGDTALLQTYETSSPGPDGSKVDYFGHGVVKLSDDGKTVNVWWFCNMSPDVMKMSGPITDNGFTLSGEGPMGPMKLELKSTLEGLSVKGTEGSANTMTETYTRAR